MNNFNRTFVNIRVTTFFVCFFLTFSMFGIGLDDSALTQGEPVLTDDVTKNSLAVPQRPNIELVEASGGGMLDITIKNTGSISYQNLYVKTIVSGGIVLSPKTHMHEVPFLGSGSDFNSWRFSKRIIGFGSGIIGSTPTVSVMVQYQGVNHLLGTIELSLFGLFMRVKNVNSYTDSAYDGYTLFTPEYGTDSYLIDIQGTVVHQWNGNYIQGMGTYLMEDGNLIRSDIKTINPFFTLGGVTGHVGIYEPDGTMVWDFEHSTDQYCLHHDIEVLPNGNILMISWEYKSEDDAIQAGRDPDHIRHGKLYPCYIIEVEPTGINTGDIVWEWHVWDHLIQDFDSTKDNFGVVGDHPEKVDINYFTPVSSQSDWTHFNSIDYHEEFDQILLSVRNLHEIWVIDHSTTTEEASGSTGGRYGKGGDLLYRWGNPASYRAGDESDQMLFRQHDANWVEPGNPGEGNIIVFNNARLDDDNPNIQYSTVDEIVPPVTAQGNYVKLGEAYGPFSYEWQYIAETPSDFISNILSGAQRLPNGNTLICSGGKGFFFEVTEDNGLVWEYQNMFSPSDDVFKVRRYAPDYPGIISLFSD